MTEAADGVARPMRLLWLTQNFPPQGGGMAESCDRIVSSLRRNGCPVDVIHFQSGSPSVSVLEQEGGLLWRCPETNDPEHLLNLVWTRIAAAAPPGRWTHVVAFGGMMPLVAGPVYAAWLGLPLLTLFRGNDFDIGIFSPRRRGVVADAVTRAAAVGAVSREMVTKIRGYFPTVKTEWLPNGIDCAAWKATSADQERARAWRLSTVPEGRRVLGLFGQLKKKKGLSLFLEALRNSGHAERFHLLIVGDREDALESELAAIPSLTSTLLPFGDRFELIPRYLACDFIALPSFYDGMPNVLLEAGALGIPCIAAKIGGMADLLVEWRHGVLFDGGNPEAAAGALARAAEMPQEHRALMGRHLFELITGGYSHVAERNRYLELLQEISTGDQGGCHEDEVHWRDHRAGHADRVAGVRRQ